MDLEHTAFMLFRRQSAHQTLPAREPFDVVDTDQQGLKEGRYKSSHSRGREIAAMFLVAEGANKHK